MLLLREERVAPPLLPSGRADVPLLGRVVVPLLGRVVVPLPLYPGCAPPFDVGRLSR